METPLYPPRKGGRAPAPQFLAHFYRGQTVACIVICYEGRPQPRGPCVRWGPTPTPTFSANVYYSYYDFVRTLHNAHRYWFVQVQVQVLVFYAFYF